MQLKSGKICPLLSLCSQSHHLHHQLLMRAPLTTVRNSDVVEMEDVQYIGNHLKRGLFCCSRSVSSPGKSKKRRVPVTLFCGKTNELSVRSPSASHPSFETALEKSSEKLGARRNGRDRRNAPVFRGI